MRESAGSFWSNCGPMDQSRNYYNDRSGGNSNDYGNNPNYNSFPPPPNYGNSGYNNNQMDGYGGNNSSMSGNDMGGSMNRPMGGNNNMDGMSSDMGPMMGGMNNSGYNNPNNDSNIISSIQSLSQQMSSQQNEIASKILTAVLSSSNLIGNMQNQSRNSYDNDMRNDYDRGRRLSRRRSRTPPSFRRRSSEYSSSRLSSRGGGRWETRGRSSWSSSRYKYESPRYRDRSDKKKRSRAGRSTSKERESKGKKRKSGTEDKKAAEGASDEKSESGEKTDKKKLHDDIPLEALYCHMCKHGNFTSVHTYLCHLEGIRHLKTSGAFHEKNEATLEYLRQNAKLASIRFGGYDRSVNTRCSICLCVVRESFLKHKKLLEHKLVSRFLKPKCCGRFFNSRYAADEHKLSLPHLRKNYDENKEKHLLLEDTPKGEYTKWTFEEAIKHLKGMNPQIDELLTLDNIPPFDGNTAIGANFLVERDALLCKPCEQLIPIGVKSLDNHMLSADHYNNVVDYLRKRRRELHFESMGKKGDSDTVEGDLKEVGEDVVGPNKRRLKDNDEDDDEDESDDDAVAEVIHLSEDEEDEQEDEKLYVHEDSTSGMKEKDSENLPEDGHEDAEEALVDDEVPVEGEDGENQEEEIEGEGYVEREGQVYEVMEYGSGEEEENGEE